MSDIGFYLHVDGFEGFDKSIDFDKRQIRSAMHRIGRKVVGHAQMNVALSPGGMYPKSRTGSLIGSIKHRVSRSGFLVKIMPAMPAGSKDYYPAYLYYGVAAGKRVWKHGRRKKPLDPRGNYITAALQDCEGDVRSMLSRALEKGLRVK